MKEWVLASRKGGQISLDGAKQDELRRRVHGRLVLPDSAEFEQRRRVWNGMIDRRPGMIVRCRGAADVVACVDFAREHDIVLAVRGGGHNVAGHAVADGGLVIDLSEMRSVLLDPLGGTASIGGGATLGDVDHETIAFELATPMGVVSETGYAGLTLHGGTGWQLRKWGLALDNVFALDLVTADGKLLRVDEENHPELFWALRGGGGNFGVVTTFHSRLHPMPQQVYFTLPIYGLDQASRALSFVRDFMEDAPDELMALPILWTVPDDPAAPAEHRGQAALFIAACFIGSPEQGERATRALRECARPLADLSGVRRWLDVQRFFDDDYPDGLRYYWKSTLVRALDDELIDRLVEHAAQRPSLLTSIDIWVLGGAFGRVPSDATAFGRRDAAFMINYESNWNEPSDDEENILWTRRSLAETKELSQSRTYLNFPGFAEEGERMLRETFAEGYERLKRVKERYDPHNLFHGNFNIKV